MNVCFVHEAQQNMHSLLCIRDQDVMPEHHNWSQLQSEAELVCFHADACYSIKMLTHDPDSWY